MRHAWLSRELKDLPFEEWRPIMGYEDRYAVSNMGRVKGLPRIAECTSRRGTRFEIRLKERVLSLQIRRDGYVSVTLGKRDKRRAHILVAEAFNGPKPEGLEVAHDNGVRHDNRPFNLTWKTRKDNAADMRRHGTAWKGEVRPKMPQEFSNW